MEKIVDEGPRPVHIRQWTQPTNVDQQQESSREMEIPCLDQTLFLKLTLMFCQRAGEVIGAFSMV